MRYRAPVLSKSDISSIIEKYRRGQSVRSLGAEYGVTFQNISLILRKCEVQARPRGRPKRAATA